MPPKGTKDSKIRVVFVQNFKGNLNDFKVNIKKGDSLLVEPFQELWLRKKKVIA
jgi:hypothetical protein